MSQATEQIARQFANGSLNKKTWGDIIYNVKVYGAKGDGIYNDTAAIKAAVNAIKVAGGGTLYFPPGVYLKNDGFVIPSNTTVQGSGKGATVIKCISESPYVNTFNTDVDTKDVVFRDFSIEGNRINQSNFDYAILLYKSYGCLIENVRINQQNGIGIGLSNSYNNTIRSCESNYTYIGYWMSIDAGQVAPYNTGNNTIDDCDAHYSDLDGIILNSSHSTIVNCRLTYNGQKPAPGALGGAGIYTEDRQDNTSLINNFCANNTEYGINVVLYNATVIGNLCQDNALSGIYLRRDSKGNISQRVSVSGNTCKNNGNSSTTEPSWGSKSGVELDGARFVTITGNCLFDDRTPAKQRYGVDAADYSLASNNVTVTGNNLKFNLVGTESLSANAAILEKYVAGNV